jgi:hypothetical protein
MSSYLTSGTPSAFPNVTIVSATIGSATINQSGITMGSGKQLILGKDATDTNGAVTLSQLTNATTALQGAINTIAGTEDALNTLQEMKSFVEGVRDTGATSLLNAVNAEQTARETAISTEQTVRAAAISTEQTVRAAAISTEQTVRAAAIYAEADARETADNMLSNRLYRHVNIHLNDGILGLAAQPTPMPSAAKAKTVMDGWYFKSPGPSVASNLRKFNWYFAGPGDESSGVAIVSTVKEINMPVTVISKVSTPFITVYTAPTGIDDATNWYKAKYTYVCNTPLTPYHNDYPNYNFRVLISGESLVGKVNNYKNVDLVLTSAASSTTPNSTLSPNDVILFVSIGSDSGAAVNNVECVVHGCNFISSHHNVEYHLTNRDVVQKYMLHKIAEVFKTLGQEDPSIGLL